MNSSSFVGDFLVSIAWQIPVLVVYGAGIVIAVLTCRKHPLVSLLAIAALGLMLVNAIAGTAATMWLARSDAFDFQSRGTVLNTAGLVFRIIYCVALAMLISAVFLGRPRKQWIGATDKPIA